MITAFFPILRSNGGSASRHILLLLIVGLGCYFGVKALYHKIDTGIGNQQSPALPAVAGDVASRGTTQEVGEIDREVIIRRNVFLANQAVPPADQDGALLDGLKPASADMILVGTAVELGGAGRAVIFDVEEKKQHLVREGDAINGASIVQIQTGKVVISRQGGNELLDIVEARKLRTAAVPGSRQARVLKAVDEPLSGYGDSGDDSSRDGAGTLRQVDINRLEEKTGGMILKGRISSDM